MHGSHERTHEVIVHACVTRENSQGHCACMCHMRELTKSLFMHGSHERTHEVIVHTCVT